MSQAAATPSPPHTDRVVVWTVVRFIAYFVGLFAAIVLIAALGGTAGMQTGLAQLAARLTTSTGVWAVALGPAVLLSNRTLAIDVACTALYVAALYAALILAYPVKARTRLLGLAVGVPIILLANVVRLVAGAHVSALWPGAFDFVHDYLFQVGMVMLTVALWLTWLAYARRDAR